jgi:mannosyltransferase OCH1-like enzyme/UDP:flavonoid glycosyltransferase YjiC (YdhE family)
MKTIVIYVDGTLGDHFPALALAQVLVARGHRVRMAINKAMHKYAERAGLEAIALTDVERGPEEARQNAWAWNHWRNPDSARPANFTGLSPDDLVTQARELIEICQGADLLLATSIRILGFVVHHAISIPRITISMNPSTFAQPVSAQEQIAFHQVRRQEYDTLKELFGYMFAQLNIDKPIPDWRDGFLFARHILLASSPYFSQPNVDQFQPHSSVDLTGFWFYQDPDWKDWQPDATLARFCERQPIALSFSSQPLEERRQTLAKHVYAAQRLGRPLLIQRGWADFSEADLPADANRDNILFADFIPHDWLFSHVACAIQHGGIGSIARALHQGCPLLIEPYGNDQFYNADRVTDLGAGAALSPFHSTVNDLTQVLGEYVLTSRCRERVQAIGAELAKEDGVKTASEMIERFLGRLDAQGHLPSVYERYTPPLTPRKRNEPVPSASAQPIVTEREHSGTIVTKQTAIPKILHQKWNDKNIPAHLVAYCETWKKHHPDWDYKLWTDIDNREFIRQNYGWFLPIYDGYPENIMRADAARYFILYHYGGVYADLDMECLRPLDSILADKQLLFGLEPPLHSKSLDAKRYGLEKVIGNAVMASVPQHPFWEHVFKSLVGFHQAQSALVATGPCFLTLTCQAYSHPEEISVAPHELFNPITNEKPWSELPLELRTSITQTAYTIHHWMSSWFKQEAQESQQAQLSLLVHGQLINKMLMSVDQYRALLATCTTLPKISCLTITKNRTEMAKRAIHCFRQQTYANRELVIIDDSPDDSLEQFVQQLNDPQINYIHLPDENRTLGELRNQAATYATGLYIAQWDDDDLSDPLRLEVQMAVIHALQTDACLLERHQILWLASRRLAVSTRRLWESSFLCAKAKLPDYAAVRRGEDTPVIEKMVEHARVGLLDLSGLYIYVFHSENTVDADLREQHWLTATESFEGPLFDVAFEQLKQRLHISEW